MSLRAHPPKPEKLLKTKDRKPGFSPPEPENILKTNPVTSIMKN
jgi:hypothetical protein